MSKNLNFSLIFLVFVFVLLSCSDENQESNSFNNSDPITIAGVFHMSGPFAFIGELGKHHLQYAVDQINKSGGVLNDRKIELKIFDDKGSPQESLVQLKLITDQNIKFIFNSGGSHVGNALTDSIKKYNQRNIGDEVIFLNTSAVASELTNEKCHFWHFRFDASVDIKVHSIVEAIRDNNEVKKIYLLNQDYSYGHTVSSQAKELLLKSRPDISIVGDEFHPLGKVKDFSPYIAKIRESGADTLLTGNWNNDLSLLIKSVRELGLNVKVYTAYANLFGTPEAMRSSGEDRVFVTSSFHPNIENYPLKEYQDNFEKFYDIDYVYIPFKYGIEMLVKAINETGSLNSLEIAKKLENMRYDGGVGEVWMRPDDHQLIQPQYISVFSKLNSIVKYPAFDTGLGWRPIMTLNTSQNAVPHRCEMKK